MNAIIYDIMTANTRPKRRQHAINILPKRFDAHDAEPQQPGAVCQRLDFFEEFPPPRLLLRPGVFPRELLRLTALDDLSRERPRVDDDPLPDRDVDLDRDLSVEPELRLDDDDPREGVLFRFRSAARFW